MTNEGLPLVAVVSVVSCLISELSKAGVIDAGALIENIQATAARAREAGNAALAEEIHALSEHLLKSVPDR